MGKFRVGDIIKAYTNDSSTNATRYMTSLFSEEEFLNRFHKIHSIGKSMGFVGNPVYTIIYKKTIICLYENEIKKVDSELVKVLYG